MDGECKTVTKLSAGDIPIPQVPVIVTYDTPGTVVTDQDIAKSTVSEPQ